jgi:phosphomevalonate kinase
MPVSRLRLTVPGNVLLLGEYAVLEEAGLGLAMAVTDCVRLEASPAETLRIETEWPGAAGSWTPEHREASPLISSVVDTIAEHLGRSPRAHVKVDSSSFFSPDGRKSGLGSSAAVTVALVCGLLRAAGADPPADAPRLALQAHRRAQGGRGSGYDVMTSFNGGAGLFTGGADPRWQPCVLPGDMRLLLFSGPAPVSTAEAVARYGEWKNSDPAAAQDFLRESNNAIVSFLRAASDAQLLLWFTACRELGIELGRAIGIPADIPVPPGLEPKWCKALGAGNELGLCLLPRGVEPPADDARFRFVTQSGTGVAWEQ